MKCIHNLEGKTNIEVEMLEENYNFYDSLLKLDEKNIKETFSNNQDWFGKNIPLEIIDDMYKRIIKPIKKGNKPRFTFKLPIVKGEIKCQLYNHKKVCISPDKLEENCEISMVIHIRGLKFLKQHYYCDVYVSQIKVYMAEKEIYNLFNECIIDDDDEYQSNNNYDDDIDILDETVMQEIQLKQQNKQKLKDELDKQKKLMEELEKQMSEY